MIKTVLIIGGSRSGKSQLAIEMAEGLSEGPLCFVATAEVKDEEMAKRIKEHQAQRGPRWMTIEEPLEIPSAIDSGLSGKTNAVVVDCLTVWVANLLEKDSIEAEQRILTAVKEIEVLKGQKDGLCIFVTNEVGMGIVPATALGRAFRDLAGRTNQLFAQLSDEVYFVVAGITQRIK